MFGITSTGKRFKVGWLQEPREPGASTLILDLTLIKRPERLLIRGLVMSVGQPAEVEFEDIDHLRGAEMHFGDVATVIRDVRVSGDRALLRLHFSGEALGAGLGWRLLGVDDLRLQLGKSVFVTRINEVPPMPASAIDQHVGLQLLDTTASSVPGIRLSASGLAMQFNRGVSIDLSEECE